jgi:hypothetical protein
MLLPCLLNSAAVHVHSMHESGCSVFAQNTLDLAWDIRFSPVTRTLA